MERGAFFVETMKRIMEPKEEVIDILLTVEVGERFCYWRNGLNASDGRKVAVTAKKQIECLKVRE